MERTMKKNMRKQWKVVLVCFVLVFVMGCGNSKENVSIDMGTLAEKLLETVKNDELTKIDSELVESTYNIKADQYEEGVVYVSSGATAMEIAIFKGKDKASVEEISKAVDTRKKEQIEAYTTYAPEQVPKLEAAIKKEVGNYIIYCVTEDTKQAENIINDAAK